MHESPLDLRCPTCGQLDQVSKVSAVHAQGTSTGQSSGTAIGGGYQFGKARGAMIQASRINLRGTQSTVLSQRLAPLPEPAAGGSPVTWAILGLAVVLSLSCLPIAGGVGSLSGSVVVGGLFLAAIWFLLGQVQNRARRPNITEAQWEDSIREWNASYYCGRCDRVFLPRPAVSAEPLAVAAGLSEDDSPAGAHRRRRRHRREPLAEGSLLGNAAEDDGGLERRQNELDEDSR